VRGKGSKLSKPCQKVRLSQDRMPIEPFPSRISLVRGKSTKLGEGERHNIKQGGKGNKLCEPCPKVRFSQDRLPIEPFGCIKS
jgi:hypothetical protein